MSRTCPQCGNLNEDEIKYCTGCGNSLESVSDLAGSLTTPPAGPVAAGSDPDPNRLSKILAGAGIAIIVIIAVFLFLIHPGLKGILPLPIPPVTPETTATPVLTSYIVTETPVPEPTIVPTENLSPATTITETPQSRPTPTKVIFCPSDRRACGAHCTDILTDPGNCGTCGHNCSSSQVCQQGICTTGCAAGQTRCFDGCYNLSYNTQNCGICGNFCPVGLVCNNSICSPPLTTAIPTYIG